MKTLNKVKGLILLAAVVLLGLSAISTHKPEVSNELKVDAPVESKIINIDKVTYILNEDGVPYQLVTEAGEIVEDLEFKVIDEVNYLLGQDNKPVMIVDKDNKPVPTGMVVDELGVIKYTYKLNSEHLEEILSKVVEEEPEEEIEETIEEEVKEEVKETAPAASTAPQSAKTASKSYRLRRADGSETYIGNSYVDAMPASLKQGFTGFTVKTNPNATWAAAWVLHGQGEIYIKSESVLNNQYIIWHEMAHVYGGRTTADTSQTWKNIYNAEWAGKGVYGATNHQEAFAETVSMVFTGQQNGSSYLPAQSSQYVKELFGLVSKTDLSQSANVREESTHAETTEHVRKEEFKANNTKTAAKDYKVFADNRAINQVGTLSAGQTYVESGGTLQMGGCTWQFIEWDGSTAVILTGGDNACIDKGN